MILIRGAIITASCDAGVKVLQSFSCDRRGEPGHTNGRAREAVMLR
jgi:hypothetical protein